MGLIKALAMSGTSLTATGRGFHPQGVSATTQRGKGLCSGSRKHERNCVHDHRLLPRCIDAHPMVVSKHCVLFVLVCCVVRESMVGCRNAGDVYVTHACICALLAGDCAVIPLHFEHTGTVSVGGE